MRNQRGFTLLEVMVATTLIVFVVFATVLSSSGGLASSARNRNVILATNLARNLINQEEVKHVGMSFERLPEKQSGNFEAPNDRYKWTIEYSKVDFSALADLIQRQSQKQNEKGGGEQDPQTGMVLRIFKDYLEKSVRRMKVTIEWPDGNGTSTQTFSQLLVNYDQDFNISI